jgi:hypothetical protein
MACDIIPIDLTSEQKAHICGVLALGCDWQTATGIVGCSLADIRRAMRLDLQFAADARRSEAGAELKCMRTIQKAAEDPKNWRACVWWLERHAPERFGPRSAGAVTARQLKAYIAILAEVIGNSSEGPMDRETIIARLKSFAESVDQLMRDEQMLEEESFDVLHPDRWATPRDAKAMPSSERDFDYESWT